MLSIQEFSLKTGIPKSALRFYEEKGLLVPGRNEGNGYRSYQEEQIELALLISSLRLANVPLKDIQRYVSLEGKEQKQMEQKWVRLLKQQKLLIDMQIKFLESDKEEENVFLYERKAERILWFSVEGNQGEFGEHFIKGKKRLERNQIRVNNTYLKYVSGREHVKAWIGFGIEDYQGGSNPNVFKNEEKLSKSLCVATHFKGDFTKIEKVYQRLVNYVSNHNYIPTGSLMEMYPGNDLGLATILIPVLQFGGDEIEEEA